MNNLQKMMQEAQKLQNTLKKRIKEFEEKEFEYKFKDYVSIKIRGNLEIIAMDINKDLIDPEDVETLNDILISAVNEAVKTTREEKEKIANSLAPGMGGFGGLF